MPAAGYPRRIAIFGLGAIGSHLAVKCALAGHRVTAIARGETYKAVADRGITLLAGKTELHAEPVTVRTPTEAEEQDLVVVSIKSTSLTDTLGHELAPMIGASTAVLFIANGIPWWYPHMAVSARSINLPLFRIGERILRDLTPERVLGGVIYSANSVLTPGRVSNNSPDRNRLFFASVGSSADAERTTEELFTTIDFEVVRSANILEQVWRKLLISMCVPPICIAAGATATDIRETPALRALFGNLLREAQEIARAQGHLLGLDIEADALLAGMPDHTPSMIVDYLAGRPIESEATFAAPVALARATCVPTPALDTLFAVVSHRLSVQTRTGSAT